MGSEDFNIDPDRKNGVVIESLSQLLYLRQGRGWEIPERMSENPGRSSLTHTPFLSQWICSRCSSLTLILAFLAETRPAGAGMWGARWPERSLCQHGGLRLAGYPSGLRQEQGLLLSAPEPAVSSHAPLLMLISVLNLQFQLHRIRVFVGWLSWWLTLWTRVAKLLVSSSRLCLDINIVK